jgi:predicted GIY-YIG superfamily endonuclease
MVKKDYAVYKLKKGGEIVYIGKTNDFTRKINEHINDGKEFTTFDFVKGWYTRREAEKIEALELSVYKTTHRYRLPKYNI